MIAGWVDLTRTAASARPRVAKGADERGLRVELPGASAEAGGRGADLHADTQRIVVCCGEPRFEDAVLEGVRREIGPAAAWSKLLERRGERAANSVRGAYAAAGIDLQTRRVILVTDRFSIHPVCYASDGTRLAFADRADTVPLSRSPELDRQALFDYLYFHVIPAPRTVFRGVERLLGGHTVVADSSNTRVFAHWNPDFVEDGSPKLEALKQGFRDVLRKAVAREADTPAIGCFLSGGTDSSTVTGLLGEVTGKPAKTFSIGFDAQGYDEMAYARIAANHFKADHHEYYITPDDLVRSIPEVAAHYDQPFGNSSALPSYYCARAAKAGGIDKLLAGDGGDELFGGNTRYAWQKVFAAYARAPEWLRTGVIEPLLLDLPAVGAVPVLRKAASYVRQARIPLPDRLATYNLLMRLGVTEALEPEFLRAVDIEAPIKQARATFDEARCSSLVNRMLAFDWKYTLADNDLPKVRDTCTLADVRVGFPLLADEVVDFSVGLPASFKVKGLRLRHFFKEALRGFLPAAIIAKRKHGFGLPFGVWLIRHEGLRALARASLAALATRGIVRPSFTEALIGQKLAEHPAFYGEMVWVLMMLEHWLAAHALERATRHIPPIPTSA